ncbi:protein translocase subunit secF /protein translocase subunit secD [Rhizobium sp. BK251]|nr:protein translocase subunit secF /protein translocase subunit secD [Rhizobium sp. BK251]
MLIWLAVLFSMGVAALNFCSDQQLAGLPRWLPAKKLALGLDLQGGTHMTLRIDRADIVREKLEATVAEVRTRLRQAGIPYTGLGGVGQVIQVRITDPAQLQAAIATLQPLIARVRGSGGLGGPLAEMTLGVNDGTQVTLQITNAAINDRMSSALVHSMDVVRRRIEEIGKGEPRVERQGADRIIVQVPGQTDPERLKYLLNQPARLSFRLIDDSMPVENALDDRAPANSQVLYSQDDPPTPYLVQRQSFVSGTDIVDAKPGFDPQTNEPVVSFTLNAAGAARLETSTREHAGGSFAVVLDDQVISITAIHEPITGGAGQIAANFSAEGAEDLSILLRAGALPAALTVVEERTVGPSLGSDSIRSGLAAGAIGAMLVAAFMLAAYGFLGLIANLALAANVIMIIAVLTLLGASLTLPGIAGIVLTLGMAVDSNVLIYERIREEARNGRPMAQSADIGFAKALATIIDANVTTFIAAIILIYVGTGPARGFAVTLAVGILTTLFTAFTLTRWIVAKWLEWRHPRWLPRGVHTGIFDDSNIRFMGIRRYTFTVSAALSIAAMAAFAVVGLNRGVDFTGGSIIEIKAKHGSADLADIRTRLDDLNLGGVQVQGFRDGSGALIRVQSQQGGENAEQSATTLVRGELADDYDLRRVEVVGPAVSGELTKSATLGIAASLGVILLYIWFRFEWQFAIGAIIATLHDVILTLGLFVLTGIEFNLASIAALLTIIGYSLNDTVVVYDRMRENLRRYPRMPLPILIDASINQTLSRTLLTSLTTLLAITALFLFGGEVIRSFAFVLLFGVAVGTFSSIYIAAPVLIAFRLRPKGLDLEDDADETSAGGHMHHGKPVV